MNRRDLVKEGLRSLVQVLPKIVATAGSLGVCLQQPFVTVLEPRPACFPAPLGEVLSPTSAPLPEEDDNDHNPS